jgi:hypothetical protein
MRVMSLAAVLALPGGRTANAQRPWMPEVRADLLVARSAALEAGVGLSLPAGVYIRPTLVAAAGPAWRDGERGWSSRVDVLARFLLDPFRESRVGLYGAGGISAHYDPWQQWRAALALVVGAELPSRAGTTWALELGLGGGFRVGLALRRAVPGRR